MSVNRVDRLNSLLKEVLSEAIHRDVKNPNVSDLVTVVSVDVTRDLRHAKVYISVIGDDKALELTVAALQSGAGFIAITASKKVVLRHFPVLRFIIDTTVEKQCRIDELLVQINSEKGNGNDSDG